MHLKKRFFAFLLSAAILSSQASEASVLAAQRQEQEGRAGESAQQEQEKQASVRGQEDSVPLEQGKILELSFDGSDGGLTSPGANVTMHGTLAFSSDDAYSGQSLRFDGNAANYLSITDENGGSLLKGQDNITISYWSKTPQTPGCNWATYLAPNGNAVNGSAPTYLAVSDQANMRVERYKDGRSPEVTGKSAANSWKMVTVVIEPGQTTMYINGQKKSQVSSQNTLSSIVGENGVLYLGRANWGAGEGFAGWLDQYTIYNYAMDQAEVKEAYGGGKTADELLQEALEEIHIPEIVTENLTLQEENEKGVKFNWTSSNEQVISTKALPCEIYYNEVDIPAGVVTRQSEDTEVTLEVEVSCKDATREESYPVIVKAKPSQEEYTGYLYAHFNEHAGGGNYDGIQQIFFGISKNGVDWTALNNNQFVVESSVGDYGVRDPYIIRSPQGDKFYLIATDLDIDSYKYGGNWGLMASQGSQGLVIWESNDLVNWTEPRLVDVASEINAGMAWAPEAIYDEATGEYLVFWSSGKTNGKCNYVYVAKTRDFWTFTEPELYSNASNLNDGTPDAEGNPRGNIDASIYKEGDTYYRLIKDESDISVRLQSSKKLLAYGPDLKEDDYVSVTKDNSEKMPNRGVLFQKINNEGTITIIDEDGNRVTKPCLEQFAYNYEGPTMFKFNDREEWCILVDEYGRGAAAGEGAPRGYIPFVSKNLDQPNSVYLPSDNEFIMPDAAKHGTVIPITQKEYDALMAKWGTPKQEGNRISSEKPVLQYDFESVEGRTVKDVSEAGTENNGTMKGDAAVVEIEGKGNVLQLNGSGSLALPEGFFDGLSDMTLSFDVCPESEGAAVFSMGSTVKNKISSYTVTGSAAGEVVTKKDRFWDNKIANKYLSLNINAQSVEGRITTFNDLGMFQVSSGANQDMKNNWKNVALMMNDHIMSIYVDGRLAGQNKHVRSVEELGSGLKAALGAAYGAEGGFKGYIDNVKVYNKYPADGAAADLVVAQIQAIGEVKLDETTKAKLLEARSAYNALSETQKALVTNLSELTKAESAYTELENKPGGSETEKPGGSETEKPGGSETEKPGGSETEKPGGSGSSNSSNQQIPISQAVIGNIPVQNYTGKPVTPVLDVTYHGKKLTAGTDFKVTYEKNKEIGTARAVITGINQYAGTVSKNFQITVFKGKTYKSGNYKYKITNANLSGKGTVTISGTNSKKIKKIKVSETVKIGGRKFKVTAIGDRAFKDCKKASSAVIGKNVQKIGKQAFLSCGRLKNITVKSAKIKSVGKNAFKGIHKKAVIKVPSKQLTKYKKLFRGKGQGKQVKIKK